MNELIYLISQLSFLYKYYITNYDLSGMAEYPGGYFGVAVTMLTVRCLDSIMGRVGLVNG